MKATVRFTWKKVNRRTIDTNQKKRQEALSEIAVVLPSFEPDERLISTIDGLIRCGFSQIILIDDGSGSAFEHFFSDAVTGNPGKIILLRHNRNLGKGAALKNGFRWIIDRGIEMKGIVTVDGDGQLLPEDAARCSLNMLQSERVTLGCRDFGHSEVPWRSRVGNRITSYIFRVLCGIRLSDTQTGLRAIPAAVLPGLIEVSGDRFEYETNMLLAMKSLRLKIDEVPITTVYIDQNKTTHFDTLKDSLRIYRIILTYVFGGKQAELKMKRREMHE